jgi:hypothetical protein
LTEHPVELMYQEKVTTDEGRGVCSSLGDRKCAV